MGLLGSASRSGPSESQTVRFENFGFFRAQLLVVSCVVEDVFARVEVCVDILLYGYSYLPFVFLLASLRSLSWAALSASS